jgi:hypothetical protein
MDPTTIDVERVTAVLLNDGWHYIQPRSFHIDPYAFTSGDSDVTKAQPGYFFAKIDQISREMQYFLGPLDYVMSVRFTVETVVVTDEEDEDGGAGKARKSKDD